MRISTTPSHFNPSGNITPQSAARFGFSPEVMDVVASLKAASDAGVSTLPSALPGIKAMFVNAISGLFSKQPKSDFNGGNKGDIIMLKGSLDTGKTASAKAVAEARGDELITVSLDEDSDKSKILGHP